jgi:hypothetical protein
MGIRGSILAAWQWPALLLACILGATGPQPARAEALELLVGNWNGFGWIVLQNGSRERMKCSVDYDRAGGDRLQQRLRCASGTYNLNGSADLRFAGDAVSGTWSEQNFGVGGPLSGDSNANGLTLSLASSTFTARYVATVGACRHQITVNPIGAVVIEQISISLRRC